MRNVVTAIVIVLACAAGVWLAAVDQRTDDTGIEAGLIFLIAAALSAVRPRAARAAARSRARATAARGGGSAGRGSSPRPSFRRR